jgi:hypothetical protein
MYNITDPIITLTGILIISSILSIAYVIYDNKKKS